MLTKASLICALTLAAAPAMAATQFSFSDSGGTVSLSSSNLLTIANASLASPAGTVNISCQLATSGTSCTGGSLSVQSSDGSTSISGTFTSGQLTERKYSQGGQSVYAYSFFANFSGAAVTAGKSSAVYGAVTETLADLNSPLNPTTGTIQSGLIDASQQFEPVIIADTGNNRLVESQDMLGSDWATLGKLGSGVNQFSSPWDVALDSAQKIYVSDSGNCRIVRMDNFQGTNWTTYGACGSGIGQFSGPEGIWVDTEGRIYVADYGNNRVVRMNDMTGTGWVALGTLGNGVGQFDGPTAVTTDATGNIYVADSVNARIVEMADMSGTNWATLQLNLLYFPFITSGVAVDSSNRIYTTDADQSQFVRYDNIAGANGIDLYLDTNNYTYDPLRPTGVFMDSAGAAYLADTGNNRVERYFDMSFNDVLALGTSGTGIGNLNQPHGLVAIPETRSAAVLALSPVSLSFPTEVVGVPSSAETVILANIGNAPVSLGSVTSSSTDFTVTSNCPASLAGGQSCSATLTFQPTAGGPRKGTLSFGLASGGSRAVPLSGNGALVSLSTSLLVMYDCASGTVKISNPLATSASIKSVKTSAGFSQKNNCGALGSGASCTVTVSWCSGTPITGVLFVTDSSGTTQFVSLTGE